MAGLVPSSSRQRLGSRLTLIRLVVPMVRVIRALCITIILHAVAQGVSAQAPATPPPILNGLTAYRAFGGDSAIAVWVRGSALEGLVGRDVARGLADLEASFGSYEGHEVLGNVAIGTRGMRTYVAIHLHTGAFYVWFDSYRSATGWLLTGFLLNAKPSEILPASMLTPLQ